MKPILRHFAKFIALGCFLMSLAAPAARAQFTRHDIPQRGTKVPKLEVLDKFITRFMSDNEISASSVGVSRNGRVIYYRSFGWMDQAQTQAVLPNVMMRVGSLTKPLVAAAAREALEEAGLPLTAQVFRHPTQSPNGILDLSADTPADARYFNITVDDLIKHMSGMVSNATPDPTYSEIAAAAALGVDSPPSARDMLRYIYRGFALNTTPGATYSYSNAGYLALGQVIEELTGRSVQEYVYDKVLLGLGVDAEDFTMGASLFENRLPREPWYDSGGLKTNVFDPNGPDVPGAYGGFNLEARVGQGAVVTTPLTFLRFMNQRDIGAGGRPISNPVVSFHSGSLDGTSAYARQLGDLDPDPAKRSVVNYCFILNKRGNAWDIQWNNTRYSLALGSMMDTVLSGMDPSDWPTTDVVASPQLRVERGGVPITYNGALDFGNTDTGVTRSFNCVVRNIGNAPFSTFGIQMDTPNGPFRLSPPTGNTMIAPGQSRVFSVSFAPTAAGDFETTVRILSDDPLLGNFPVRFRGTGVLAQAPTVTFAQPLVFGAQGSSAVLIATVTGAPPPSLAWKKGSSVRRGEVNPSLVFPSLTQTDASDYTLTATNHVRAVSATVKLAIIDTADKDVGVANNGTLILTAPVSHPSGITAEYQWFHEGSPLTNQTLGLRSITGATGKTLRITKINAGDAGAYFCRCTLNGIARDTGTTTVTVQSAVPAITNPGTQSWRVGSSVSLNLTITNPPYTLTVTGLPAGLTLQPNGSIFGKPTANGIGAMTIRAQNAVGSSQIRVPWSVAPLNTGTSGRYTGLISRTDDAANELYNLGGSFTLDITTNASFSGQLRLETEQISMTGQLETLDPANPTGSFIMDRNGAPLTFSFTVQPATGNLTGSLMVGSSVNMISVTGWRNRWSTSTPFSRTGNFNAGMMTPADRIGTDAHPDMPQGAGYFTAAVANTGTVLCAGRTADGAAFTSSSHLSSSGQFALHSILNSNVAEYAGSISGTATVSTLPLTLDHVDGTVSWMKRAGYSRHYRDGIPLHDRTIVGGRYTAPVARPILGLPLSVAGLANASLIFDEAHVESASFLAPAAQEFEQVIVISTRNVVSFPSNPGEATCVINSTSGLCSGLFKLTDSVSGSLLQRTALWNALAVPRLGNAVGYFTLPQLPNTGEDEYDTPILSGYAELGSL